MRAMRDAVPQTCNAWTVRDHTRQRSPCPTLNDGDATTKIEKEKKFVRLIAVKIWFGRVWMPWA